MTHHPGVSMQSSLGKARGLGSARSGVTHFWHQRVSAIFLAISIPFFVVDMAWCWGQPYQTVHEYFHSIGRGSFYLFLCITLFYHAWLGGKVIIEDYVHHKGLKLFCLLLMQAVCAAGTLVGLVSLVRLVVL